LPNSKATCNAGSILGACSQHCHFDAMTENGRRAVFARS
jgi:hypothetical protein